VTILFFYCLLYLSIPFFLFYFPLFFDFEKPKIVSCNETVLSLQHDLKSSVRRKPPLASRQLLVTDHCRIQNINYPHRQLSLLHCIASCHLCYQGVHVNLFSLGEGILIHIFDCYDDGSLIGGRNIHSYFGLLGTDHRYSGEGIFIIIVVYCIQTVRQEDRHSWDRCCCCCCC
jgi:hypothetical protein